MSAPTQEQMRKQFEAWADTHWSYIDPGVKEAARFAWQAAFAAGWKARGERDLASIQVKLDNVTDLLNKGKGEWPKLGYVRDDTWHGWKSRSYALTACIEAIREEDAE